MVKGAGLLSTVAGRARDQSTSSTVSGEPSENFTPGRSLNSHVVSSTSFQRFSERRHDGAVGVHPHQRVEDV